ncbi:MAG: hypothetical protein WD009_10670, partial [Phycisphaeraceae bacterium]
MSSPTGPMREKLGICQWFHYLAHDDVHRAVALMQELGVHHLRTGISWADFHRPRGEAWHDWQLGTLADAGFELLVSIWHTPPSISEGGCCASPPRCLEDYAGFVGQVIETWGDRIAAVELWNEPNNLYKWDFETHDADWAKFGCMVARAGAVAAEHGMPTVLGGMIPVDPAWLGRMKQLGALEAVDVVGIHGFPEMWWRDAPSWDWYETWRGWPEKLAQARAAAEGKPIWITETGLATWDAARLCAGRHELQGRRLRVAAGATEDGAERVYWYSLVDLDPRRQAIEGFHVDENEYHLGLVTAGGRRKPAFEQFRRVLAGELEPVMVDQAGPPQPAQAAAA